MAYARSLNTSSTIIGVHKDRMDIWAASQVWLGMGRQGIELQGVPGSIPEGIKFRCQF